MFANGTGILIHGVDGVRASNLAVFRASVGISLQSNLPGAPAHGVWGTFTNLITDYCVTGMLVNGSNTVQLNSGSFQSHESSLDVRGDGGSLRIAGSRFKSNGDAAVQITGSNIVTISGSGISRVFESVSSVPALRIGSDPEQAVTVTGCDVEASDPVVVECGGLGVSPTIQPLVCANGTVMLASNFVRVSRSGARVRADPGRRWGADRMRQELE
eukprot:TRINITY_DN7057_c0_g1_i8.p1 TRINITY_DN7057_c0_g1~~TRINITY_DN7057_c0_g1_i8.p1  ORF type:complete len:215 (+),score=37.32 TRINITY_DN7057_c0_g1_i8:91-735(+)